MIIMIEDAACDTDPGTATLRITRARRSGGPTGMALLAALTLLYSALLAGVFVFGAPFWLFRMVVSGRYRAGLAGRLGRVPADLAERCRGNVIWLHAVSVGEVLAAAGLIRALERELPGWTIAVSTTTATGQRLARERLPGSPVFYLPLDFATLMRRYLRAVRPGLVILMESELWPNMLRECRRAGVPTVVANARVSDRSFPRYLRLRRMWRPLFALVTRFLAQGEESARRLLAIGATPEQVRVTGNLKYDPSAAPPGAMIERVRARLAPGAPVIVAGSTLGGEEAIVLDAWRRISAAYPGALLILAPRHPQRFAEVAALLTGSGLAFTRASMLDAAGATASSPGSVLLLDTIGDLAGIYSLATVAFVGGSLVDAGGHNPLEPARFAVPVLLGASVHNFREIVEAMQATNGVRMITAADLPATILDLLRDRSAAELLGQRGQAVFSREAGATERTVREVVSILGSAAADLRDCGDHAS